MSVDTALTVVDFPLFNRKDVLDRIPEANI